jgi:hypothetical protein
MIEKEEVYYDISPYKRGDILMYIGGYEKMVVVGGGHYHYGVWQMIKVHVMNTHSTCEMPKSEADWNCVKVGEWDFDKCMEIEDGQS